MTGAPVQSFECEKRVQQTISFLPAGGDFVAVKLETSVRLSGHSDRERLRVSDSVEEFICKESDLSTLRHGNELKAPYRKFFLLMTPAVLDFYRFDAFSWPVQLQEDPDAYGLSDHDMLAMIYPFTALEQGVESTLVELRTDTEMLHDPVAGDLFPMAIPMNYIKGNLSNGKYDLDKTLEVLESNPDVTIHQGKNGEKVLNIPYYNAFGGRNRHISILFTPDRKTMNEIWKTAHKLYVNTGANHLREAIDHLDSLGLKSGGALLQPCHS